MTGDTATILRPGGITPSMIEKVLGKVELDKSLMDKNVEIPKSPE